MTRKVRMPQRREFLEMSFCKVKIDVVKLGYFLNFIILGNDETG